MIEHPRDRKPRLDTAENQPDSLAGSPADPSFEVDPEGEVRYKAKVRAVEQSARCAKQDRVGGAFKKKKKQKTTTSTIPAANETPLEQLSTIPAQLSPHHEQLSGPELAAFLKQLHIAYKSAVQNALGEATSGILHSIQSSQYATQADREEAVHLWQQATASAAAAVEMVEVPTLNSAIQNANINSAPTIKRARVVDKTVVSHKSARRAGHKVDHTKRAQKRLEADEAELAEDTIIAVRLSKQVKGEMHYSERRLLAVSAYFQARARGMSRGSAERDAARSMDVSRSTVRRWKKKYLSEGDGFFVESRWGAHSKTPYLLADKTLQKEARQWVREHAAQHKDEKGNMEPNMKVADFQDYLNSVLIPKFALAWGDTINFDGDGGVSAKGSHDDIQAVGAAAEGGRDATELDHDATAAQGGSGAAGSVVACDWDQCYVSVGPIHVPTDVAMAESKLQPVLDAHVVAYSAHLRHISLKAIAKKASDAKKAGKRVQYASLSAAKSYLHRLGFNIVRKGKSSFVDGHERADVLASRTVFLKEYFDFYDNGLNFVLVDGEYVDKDQLLIQDPDKFDRLKPEDYVRLPESDRPVMAAENGRPALDGRIPIFCYQDESTFRVNDKESWQWSDGSAGCTAASKKSEGAAFMVSGWLVESKPGHLSGKVRTLDLQHNMGRVPTPPGLMGYKELLERDEWDVDDVPEHLDVGLEVGKNKEGYWGSAPFQKQVQLFLSAFEDMYPSDKYVAVLILDHSSGHRAKAESARNVQNMNVNPGGKQHHIRDGWYMKGSVRKVQKIGTRGMRAVLEQRGLVKKTDKINADALAELLSAQPDFLEERPEVEIDTQNRGHFVLWNPKFHAELNPIEMKWAAMKDYTRKHTKESMAATKTGVVEALKQYTYSTGEKHCAHARRYMRAYRTGTHSDGVEAEMMAKEYTGHRTGGEGAVQIVLANSQQPITASEAESINYIMNREQWRRHKQGVKDRTTKLLQSKIRRLQQSHGLPDYIKSNL